MAQAAVAGASQRERLYALSVAVGYGALDAVRESYRRYREQDVNRLYHLSVEFLIANAMSGWGQTTS
jgi:hypothetical protein